MSHIEGLKTQLQGKRRKPVVYSGIDNCFDVEPLPCGIAAIDYILGGGLAYGRLSELFGNYSTGKSYLLYLFLAMNQRLGGTSVLFESEGAYSKDFFRSIGGSPEDLLVRPANATEDIFDGMADISKYASKQKDDHRFCVGWDSIAGTGTKHLQKTGMEKRDMSKAGSMTQGCQYITALIAEQRICVIATNQTRDTIGEDYDPMKRTHTPGGRAWPFHASQRLELQYRGGFITQTDEKGEPDHTKPSLGQRVRAFVDKNRLCPPHQTCELTFYNHAGYPHPLYGTPTKLGVDYAESLYHFYRHSEFRLPNGNPVIQLSGSWNKIDESVAEYKKFYAKDWLKVLEDIPDLWQLAYTKPADTSEDK